MATLPASDKEVTALVLGVGGNVSQGILKALSIADVRCRTVGACVSPLSAGLYATDRAYVSPFADDPGFLEWLIDICASEGVDAILSGVEPVLAVLAAGSDEIRERTGAVTIVSPPQCLQRGQDKLATARWLQEHGFPAPRTADAADRDAVAALVDGIGFPLVAKPRRGKSGHGVMTVHSARELDAVGARPDYVIQESIGSAAEEYTVACFSDRDGEVRGSCAMLRELEAGTTYRARVGEFPEVEAESRAIAEALRPLGPSNMQFRVSDRGPVCFEINVRFSGTAPIRARLGFNDVEASLRHFVLGEDAVHLPRAKPGVALRYWNELYVDAGAAGELERTGRLGDPRKHHLAVEDWGTRR